MKIFLTVAIWNDRHILAGRISEFRTVSDIAVQAHDDFESKLCQPMKQELDEYLSKESNVTAYHTKQAFVDGFKVGAQMMLRLTTISANMVVYG